MPYSLIVILSIFLLSCESEVENDIARLGVNYFPLSVGQFRQYDVIETRYYLIGPEKEQYQIREDVVDSTLISNTHITYKIDRYKRADESDTWSLDSVWTANVNTQRAVLTENNIDFIKLVFPILTGNSWDANTYNSDVGEFYRYEDVLMDTLIADIDYFDAIKVIQSDLGDDGLGRDDRYEIYAPNTGLIYKNSIIWEYCQGEDCSVDKQIVGGRELEMVLIEYGEFE
ncbi:MAG: hypothetical protein OCD76_01710 [Reichenbachiella sp.]